MALREYRGLDGSPTQDIAELPQDDPSCGIDTHFPVHDTTEEEEEQFSRPTSLSSTDGLGHHQHSPESEERRHKGKEEQFSLPKSLSSKMDRVESMNCKSTQCGRKSSDEHCNSVIMLMDVVNKLKNVVDLLKSERERNRSAGLDGNSANEKNTIPWQFFRVCLPKIKKIVAFCSFIVAVGCIGFLYGRANSE